MGMKEKTGKMYFTTFSTVNKALVKISPFLGLHVDMKSHISMSVTVILLSLESLEI